MVMLWFLILVTTYQIEDTVALVLWEFPGVPFSIAWPLFNTTARDEQGPC